MTADLLPALMVFALATSITPGPNNIMLMTSGANFGFRRSVPHMLGIGGGFTLMIVLVGLGLARAFEVWPMLNTIMLVLSVLYTVWLAGKIATAAAPGGGAHGGRPLTFLQAALFQWVNPKAWAMALTAVTVYMPVPSWAALLVVAGVFGSINLPSVSLWAAMGVQLRRWLTNPRRLRLFNRTMAALLVASLYPVLVR